MKCCAGVEEIYVDTVGGAVAETGPCRKLQQLPFD